MCSIFFAWGLPAAAQDDIVSRLQGEERLLLQELPSVYTASRYDQKITDAPASVSIVTADDMKKFGYRTLADVLRSLKGFYVTYDRNYAYLNSRGFARSGLGDYNNRFLVLVDGHRLNDGVYDSVLIETGFPVDIDLLERIEVVRSPSSSLYGNHAFFGVINVLTKRGRDLQGGEVSGEVGSYDTYKGRLTYGRKWPIGLETLFSGSGLSSAGPAHLYFPEFDTPESNHGVIENQDGDRAYNVFGKVTLRDVTLQGGHASRTKEIPTASFGTVFNHPLAHTLDERSYAELLYARPLGTRWRLETRAAYDRVYYRGDYPYDNGVGGAVANRDSGVGESVGGDVQLLSRVLQRHTFTIGGDFRYVWQQRQRNFDRQPFAQYLDSMTHAYNWGLYAQDEFRLFDRLTLHVGLRYDRFDFLDGEINPRAALLYSPWSSTTLKFLYGTAFRAPNAYERFYRDNLSQKPSTNLQPETIRTYELVLEQAIGAHIRGSIAGFSYTIDHLITLQTDPEDALLVYRNGGEVTAKGVEVELEGKWLHGVTGRMNYTYQLAEDSQTGQPLVALPQHLAHVNLSAPLIPAKLFAGLEWQYTSARTTLGGGEVDGFSVTNFTLSTQHFPLHGLSATFSVYNLLDEHYHDPASEEHLQESLRQNGRTFRFKLLYAF